MLLHQGWEVTVEILSDLAENMVGCEKIIRSKQDLGYKYFVQWVCRRGNIS